MGLFSFGNRAKPKKFGYIPRFYDPDKEDLEARLSQYGDNPDGISSTELSKRRIKTGFRMKHRGDPELTRRTKRNSNLLLILFVLMLGLVAYKVLTSQAFIRFMEAFMATPTVE